MFVLSDLVFVSKGRWEDDFKGWKEGEDEFLVLLPMRSNCM